MTFFKFSKDDVVNVEILARPTYSVQLNGDQVTGSVYLEKKFLNDSLLNRKYEGFSLKEGSILSKTGPFTASIDIVDAEEGATNKQLYRSILNLYRYYSTENTNYTADFTGSTTSRFRVITIPEIYYDREILSGSLTASDLDNAGASRVLYDDGLGGIYSGSISGTLVGNIFYSEGLIVLKGGGLNDESNANDFGEVSPTNFKWKVDFKGVHKIPVNIFKCRAPANELNASTNPTFYDEDPTTGTRTLVLTGSDITYITTVGLYNDDYELVATAKLAQPIKKKLGTDVLIRLRLDR